MRHRTLKERHEEQLMIERGLDQQQRTAAIAAGAKKGLNPQQKTAAIAAGAKKKLPQKSQAGELLSKSGKIQKKTRKQIEATPEAIDDATNLPDGTAEKIFDGIISYLKDPKTGGKVRGEKAILNMVNFIAHQISGKKTEELTKK